MDTKTFLKKYGNVVYRGFACGGNKNNFKDRKGKIELTSIDEALDKFPYLLGMLLPCVVSVDYDDQKAFQCRLEIAKEKKEHCIAIESPNRGGHFLFYDNNNVAQKSTNKNKTLLTLSPVDYKCGYKVIKSTGEIKQADNYDCLCTENGSLRKVVYCSINDDQTLDQIPFYDLPLQSDSKFSFLGFSEGDGRQEGLFNYMIPVKKAGYTYEQYRIIAELIDQFVFSDSLGDEFDNAIRKDAWDSINVAESKYFQDGKFLHNKFAAYLIEKYHIKNINGYVHVYKDGVYVSGYDVVEKLILDELDSLSKSRISEVLNYIRIKAPEAETTNLNYIAFKNGIYNLEDDSLEPFSPDIVVTNKIPWNYNLHTKRNSVDDVLDRLSCNDEELRYSLEEIAGACLYRSPLLGGGMGFILVGDRSNGKSTYLHMIESMLGKENYSALDIRELGDRFSTMMMYGKLANIGDDISSEYISDTSVIKKLITGETIKAENKGEKPINFVSYATQIFSANSIPRMKSTTGAIERRLLTIPFNAKFTKDSSDYDPFISKKLATPECMERFIYLAICGLQDVLNLKCFTIPAKAEEQKEEYELENHPILAFIEDVGKENIINEVASDVYKQYQVFCADNGFKPESRITFSKNINKILGTVSIQKWVNGKNVKVFCNP